MLDGQILTCWIFSFLFGTGLLQHRKEKGTWDRVPGHCPSQRTRALISLHYLFAGRKRNPHTQSRIHSKTKLFHAPGSRHHARLPGWGKPLPGLWLHRAQCTMLVPGEALPAMQSSVVQCGSHRWLLSTGNAATLSWNTLHFGDLTV